MSYRAVLFDLDGTLLDTIEDLGDSTNAMLEQMGFRGHGYDEYRFFIGDGARAMVERALPEEHRDEDTIARGVEMLRAEYGKRWADKTRPYDGVPELLGALSGTGMKTAILSNKPDDFTKLLVAKLLGEWQFGVVRGAVDGVPRKPDPAGALAVAAELGVEPAGVAYVGDTNTDMITAAAAGMDAFGATWGFRPRSELVESGAKRLLEEPQDLLRHLGRPRA